eukprot:gene7643-8944_t
MKRLSYPIRISFAKTLIYLEAPLLYMSTEHSKAIEMVLWENDYKIFSTCSEVPGDSTCPRLRNSTSGRIVPSSQGFCCTCQISELFGGQLDHRDPDINCGLFSSRSASAHCLTFDPLLYDVFTVGTPKITFEIKATVHDFDWTTGSERATVLTISDKKSTVVYNGIAIRLVGSFQMAELFPDFTDRYLVAVSNLSPDHPRKKLPFADTAMLLPLSYFGADCNKIGVGYAAFQNQPSKCGARKGSCLENQIEDYYASDLARMASGIKGHYIIKNYGRTDVARELIRIEYPQKHTSLVSVVIKADDMKFVINKSPGFILEAYVTPFISHNNGTMHVGIKNNGTLRANYMVAVENCSIGIITPIEQQAPIEPQQPRSFSFEIYTDNPNAATYQCTVSLYDAIGEFLDSKIVIFSVNATIYVVNNGTNTGKGGDSLNGRDPVCEDYCPSL